MSVQQREQAEEDWMQVVDDRSGSISQGESSGKFHGYNPEEDFEFSPSFDVHYTTVDYICIRLVAVHETNFSVDDIQFP